MSLHNAVYHKNNAGSCVYVCNQPERPTESSSVQPGQLNKRYIFIDLRGLLAIRADCLCGTSGAAPRLGLLTSASRLVDFGVGPSICSGGGDRLPELNAAEG